MVLPIVWKCYPTNIWGSLGIQKYQYKGLESLISHVYILHIFQGKYDIDDWNNPLIKQTWNLSQHVPLFCFLWCGACGWATKIYAWDYYTYHHEKLVASYCQASDHNIICDFSGESALHFAVVHEDLESVKLIVEKGANVNQRATGRFFLPEDQKKEPKAKHTDYNGKKLLFS